MRPIVLDIETIAIGDVESYIEPASAPENYKKPEAIAAYQAEAKAKAIDKAGLDVDLLQIVALGVHFDGRTNVHLSRDLSESQMLSDLWAYWSEIPWDERAFVTFNGCGFDVPALLRRSLYLGVKAPLIQCDRFKHPQVVDLMAILSMDGKLRAHGLQFYLNRFGYTGGGPDITGAEIAERYADGDWAAIEQHCRMDMEATKWLAERIGAIPKAQRLEAVPVGTTGIEIRAAF